MRGEPIGPNPGLHEYTHPNGFKVRFDRNNHFVEDWNFYRGEGTFQYEALEVAVAGILRQDFVQQTLRHRDPTVVSTTVEATLIQQGRKNGIFRVDTGPHSFALPVSRGPELIEETINDARNLTQLHRELVRLGLPVFVPQTYEVVIDKGVLAGFSTEYLPEHLELECNRNYSVPNPRTFFVMNTAGKKADRFAKRMEASGNRSVFEETTRGIKMELLTRLAIIHRLTGCVPAQFCVNAGDFMIDPDKPDFDLRLITVRGGWQQMSEKDFIDWLYKHEEYNIVLDIPKLEIVDGRDFPLFDEDMKLIEEGVKRGHKIVASATSF